MAACIAPASVYVDSTILWGVRVTPELFFQGRLVGWGVARSLFGVVLRRYTIVMDGEWSEEHRALHLDETYTYVGGESRGRQWAIHTDDEGAIIGFDALETARMRGKQLGNDFQIIFDRPRRPGSRIGGTVQRIHFVEVNADESLMLGHVLWMGVVPIASIYAALRRVA